jgi:hypothetical protein
MPSIDSALLRFVADRKHQRAKVLAQSARLSVTDEPQVGGSRKIQDKLDQSAMRLSQTAFARLERSVKMGLLSGKGC